MWEENVSLQIYGQEGAFCSSCNNESYFHISQKNETFIKS